MNNFEKCQPINWQWALAMVIINWAFLICHWHQELMENSSQNHWNYCAKRHPQNRGSLAFAKWKVFSLWCVSGKYKINQNKFCPVRSNQFTLSKVQEIIAHQFPESKFPQNFQQLRSEALKMYFEGENIQKMIADRQGQLKAMAMVGIRRYENIILSILNIFIVFNPNIQILSDLFVGIATQENINQQLALQNGANIFLYTFEYCNPRLLTLLGIIFNSKFPLKGFIHFLIFIWF